ncbi:o-succinylbenzoate--CoA ligase [Mixta theicola]|uniref:O-succinylbenzoate--CoA ligase n=1 Tax=Mixta theicola TaxID=1458355 RepID=A0A2K1QAP5_9GAMM|nr:o-succinylbenzoate--CoA ligase [Mixta theicola]PNS12114.1 o-succinylbenzoate--CoA ligase [Mixta theicola]GLR10715.1 2-succinylbenzoate-CoA ligase [Mixta theicola]
MGAHLLSDFPWRVRAQTTPAAIALRAGEEQLSWRALTQRLDRLCAGFQRQGITTGALVALRGKNSLPLLLAWLALLQAGARVLPLNPQLPPATLLPLLSALNPAFMLDLAEPLPDDVPALPRPLPAALRIKYAPRATASPVIWRPEAIASLTLTSGSTGLPKAAAHTFQALLLSAAGVNQLINFTAAESWLLSLPLYHVSGQGIVWRWLLAGACLALPAAPLPQALSGCSFASLVPTQLWRLLQQPQRPAGLKAVLLGGAAIPPDLVARAEAAGIGCWCGYGLTESAATVCGRRAGNRFGVGAALAGREVQIVDGEIWIRGATLASGYWRDGRLWPLTNQQGWFATGDLGRWHQGELQVLGRKDNLFFSGGEAVQPEAIESLLMRHPAVTQAFIIPQADAEWGARPVALLSLAADGQLAIITAWAREQLASFQRPVRWLLLPEGLAQGGIKLSRRQLAQWLQATQQNS